MGRMATGLSGTREPCTAGVWRSPEDWLTNPLKYSFLRLQEGGPVHNDCDGDPGGVIQRVGDKPLAAIQRGVAAAIEKGVSCLSHLKERVRRADAFRWVALCNWNHRQLVVRPDVIKLAAVRAPFRLNAAGDRHHARRARHRKRPQVDLPRS